jgi:tetratricopeptide (TPR) repeat protein
LTATRTQCAAIAGFFATLLVSAFAYLPGLSGPFLLDDYLRIGALGDLGGVTDGRTLLAYLDSAWTGKTGRPLALLSFLIDHNNWPAPAWDFKYTNLMVHLLNGCLLFAFSLRLVKHAALSEHQRLALALFCTFGWLAHPLLVSTTLYPVQRMAMLSTTAVLAGLLGYLVAREGWERRPRRALALMTLALGLGGGAGMLAKENAALIVPLALVLESTVLRWPRGAGREWRYWRWVVLGLPSLALLGYLTWLGLEGLDGWDHRDFNSLERVLTQARILIEYLYYWFIPQATTPGVLNSNIAYSRGLLTPWTTLPALLAIIALVAVCIGGRRRAPWLAASLGFFLVGHALESTTIGLELYFEHRNYLAGLLLWLPVGMLLLRLPLRRRTVIALFALVPLVLASLTYFRATTWGDAKLLTLTWIEANPRSERAYASAALALQRADRHMAALQLLNVAVERLPNSFLTLLHAATLNCRLHEPSRPILYRLRQAARDYHLRGNHYRQLEMFVNTGSGSNCERLSMAYTHSILQALLSNLRIDNRDAPLVKKRRSEVYHLLGNLQIASGQVCRAYRYYALAARGSLARDGIAKQAALLASNGLHREALEHLAHAADGAARNRSSIESWFDYPSTRIESLRSRIQNEAEQQRSTRRCPNPSDALDQAGDPSGDS